MNQKNNQESVNSVKNECVNEEVTKDKNLLDTLLISYPLILSSISLVGMIWYFVYFWFVIGYFPVLDGSEIFYIGTLLFSISSLFLFIAIVPIFFYPSYRNRKKLYFGLSVTIIMFLLLCVTIYFFCQKNSFLGVLTIIVMLLMLIIYFCVTKATYNNGDYKSFLCVLLLIGLFYSPILFIGQIAEWLEISNINYKYIVIEKGALGAISDKIYQNGKNIGKCKTYYEEDKVSDTIKLYDIKALSTLGKFYYLEAIGCENNEEIKFELDASKIISRKK